LLADGGRPGKNPSVEVNRAGISECFDIAHTAQAYRKKKESRKKKSLKQRFYGLMKL